MATEVSNTFSATVAQPSPSSWLIGCSAFDPSAGSPVNLIDQWVAWIGYEPQSFMNYIPRDKTWDQLVSACNPTTGTAYNYKRTLEYFGGRSETNGGNPGTKAGRNLIPLVISTPITAAYDNPVGGNPPVSISNRRGQNPNLWGNVAGGAYDTYYTGMANNFAAAMTAHNRNPNGNTLIIRLGWEMNGEWYQWALPGANATQSANNVTNYKAGWNRITNIFKSIMPEVRFDWSPAMPRIGFYWDGGRNYSQVGNGLAPLDAMPTQNVDFCTRSTHDNHPFTTDLGTGTSGFQRVHVDPLAYGIRNYGLQEFYDAAHTRGIGWGMTEWATEMSCCGTVNPNTGQCEGFGGPASDPDVFLQGVREFLESHTSRLAIDLYFDQSCTRLFSRTGTAAAQYYKAQWGGSDWWL